jgi:putative protease
VKIYVTVNTIVYDNEFEELITYVEFLHKNGVDAVIVQDLGVIDLLRKVFPNLEIHASTQTHNFSIEGIKLLKDIGVKRTVVARELTIDEVKEASKIMDVEVFIHGALCTCYSGQCLMSSEISFRSGNRGECIQACRLPYKLFKDNHKYIETTGSYLLSPKDLCTINNIKEILTSGVASLKIEGRMKSKEYVYLVTSLYRKAIDMFYNNEEIIVDESLIEKIQKEFNRGFTKGHLFGDKKSDLMNPIRPNHAGVKIGEVIKVTKDKITAKLISKLNQGDGIKFEACDKGFIVNMMYKDKLLVNSADIDDIVEFNNTIELTGPDTVLKTLDIEISKYYETIENKRIPINIIVKAKENETLKITLNDEKYSVIEEGVVVEKSINAPTSEEKIIEQVSKLGNTPFTIKSITAKIDPNIFVPIKEINELRRKAVERLISLRETRENVFVKNKYELVVPNYSQTNFRLNISVYNEKQLIDSLNNEHIDNIYIRDYELYKKFEDKANVFYYLPRLIKTYEKATRCVIQDLGSLNYYKKGVTNYPLNIVNSYSVAFLHNMGVETVTLSSELPITEIKTLIESYNQRYGSNPNLEIIVYGRYEAMIIKHLVLDMNIDNLDINDKYYLEDKKGNEFRVLQNKNNTTILSSRFIDYSKTLNDAIKTGVMNFRIELLDEDNVDEIIEKFKDIKR